MSETCATCGSDGSDCVDCDLCDYCGGPLTGEEELMDVRHLFPADTGEVVCERCLQRMLLAYPNGE